MEDITDADYTHAKRVCKDFEIKHLQKNKVKLDLLTDVNMLLMLEKLLGKEYVTLLINMQKIIANT